MLENKHTLQACKINACPRGALLNFFRAEAILYKPLGSLNYKKSFGC
jgi:hypothetical protein